MSISGQRSGKVSDRRSFVNLVSQYIKEKRSLGDVKAGTNGNLEAKGTEMSRAPALTIDLLTNMANSTENSRPSTSSDLFPQAASACLSASEENRASLTDIRRRAASVEARTGDQMTIFYKGQVVVYNDFPGGRAKEIMALASQGCSATETGCVVDTLLMLDQKANTSVHKVVPTNHNIPDLNMVSASGCKPGEENPGDRTQATTSSDLPIARRNSLHKFLAKRKDRAVVRAPYQVHSPRQSPLPKVDEGQSSGEGSKYLDLNL